MYGTIVRRARERRRMTQAELARVSAIAQPNISAIEQGRRTPTAETLQRLLAACGYTLVAHDGRDTLVVWGDEERWEPAALEDRAITPETPMPQRVRALTAVLDVAEAVVRARAR